MTLSYSTSDAKVASLAVYRGVDTTSPVDVYDDATTASGTSVAASALTTTNPGDELVFVGGAGQQGLAGHLVVPRLDDQRGPGPALGHLSDPGRRLGPATGGSTGSESATASVSGQLAAVFFALTPGTVTTTTSYDADDEATLVTDPDGNADAHLLRRGRPCGRDRAPVGVAANSLTASSCPTSYPSDYGDRLATDATTTAYDALGRQDDSDHSGTGRALGL